MTEMRIAARNASLTPFHLFLQRAIDEGRVFRCLTRNFDGLETRDRADLTSQVTMLHGDNRILTCPAPHCCNVDDEDEIRSYDQNFLNREDVNCPGCIATSEL